jgi:zinc protease
MSFFRNARRAFILLVTLAAFAGIALDTPAQGKTQLKKIVTIEGITEYQLDNGARVLLFPDPSASTVTINMTVFVGSRHEGYGETGMAHLLEHMLFLGCKEWPKPGDMDKAMQEHGASESNGTTWTDRTNYYETMPANDKNLEFGIKLEAYRLVTSFIRREDLAAEMKVVRNEFEQGENSPGGILYQRMLAAAYEWHNYGKSTIGNRADIEKVPIDKLQAFYKKYYQPDNIMLVIAGKFNDMKALGLVEKYFGAIPRPKRELAKPYTEEPAQDGERIVNLRRVGKNALVGTNYHIPAGPDKEYPAVLVLKDILTRPASGRLHKALIDTKKATTIAGYAYAWHDPGVVTLMAQVNDKVKPEEVRDILVKEVEDLAQNPVTEAEVKRSQQRLKAQRTRSLRSSKQIAIELSEWAGAGDWRLLFLNRDRVAKVTPQDVMDVAKKYLTRSNRTVGMFFPTDKATRTPVPAAPDVAELVKDYKGGPPIAEGEPFDPTPANLEGRAKRLTLSSGLKVALLAKKTRGEGLVGQLTLHFGTEKTLDGLTTACEFIGPLMTRGHKKMTREEVQERLDELDATLSGSSGTGRLSMSWQAKRQTMGEFLDLLRDVLRSPTFPQKEFDELKAQSSQELQENQTDPSSLAERTLTRKLAPYPKDNIRYTPTFPEELERVNKTTRDQVAKIYADQIGGAMGELVIVGDFDPDMVVKKLETIFADWKTKTPYERIQYTVEKVPADKETIDTPDKESAVIAAGLTFAMKDSDKDYVPLLMANYLFGGNSTSRLWDRLRIKGGFSYSVSSSLSVSTRDPYTSFSLSADFNPDVLAKVESAMNEELAKVVKDGFTAAELKDGIKGYLEEMKVSFSRDSGVASRLRSGLELGRTFAYYADLQKKIEALTLDDVNGAVRRRIVIDRLVLIRAGDFSKKAKEKK